MIEFKEYSFYYKKGESILNGFNFKLPKGRIYGLFGLNGSGKTTFLHALSGLNFPKSGQIIVNDFLPKERNVNFLSSMYFLPDAISLPKLSISTYEKVYSVYYPKFSKSDFDSYLKMLKVDRSQKLHEISFGQQKKFQLAFAIACNCDYLFLDEPTNGLDIPSKIALKKILLQQMTDDKTVIISTHQAKDLDQIIEHILVLNDNQILVNEDLYSISQKIACITYNDLSEIDPNHIISEKAVPGGIQVIKKNTEQEVTEIPMEQFINACFEVPQKVNQLLTA